MQVDHVDGNPLNNCKSNLRIVTSRHNCQNRHYSKSSKYPGVSWKPLNKKWTARITINAKEKYLGLFENEHDAKSRQGTD